MGKDCKRCCFAGHSKLYGQTEKATRKIITVAEDLILNHNVKSFWVGHYGSFDGCSGYAIRELKKKYSYITLDLIIPYLTKEINDYKKMYERNFDNIIVADVPEGTPRRFYISKANEYIVDNSDFLICYIDSSWGGAYTTYCYAKRKKKRIFNIAEKPVK